MTNFKKNCSTVILVLVFFFSVTADALCETIPLAKENKEEEMTAVSEAHADVVTQLPMGTEEKFQDQCGENEIFQKTGNQVGKIADVLHRTISRQITNSAAWLDTFFSNERSLAEENHSNIRLKYNFFWEDSSSLSQKPSVGGRLVLPSLQKKTYLIFSADPDEKLSENKGLLGSSDSQQVVIESPKATESEKRRLTAALQYFLTSTAHQSISARTGLRFNDMRPAVFAAPRYRLLIPIYSWDFRLTQEIMYRTDTKWQETTRLDLERPMKSLFLRFTAEGTWFENTPGYFYSVRCALFQPIGDKKAFDYELINSFQTEPTGKLTDIIIRARYRQQIWRNWIYFDIVPQCRFPSDQNRQWTPGIFIGLEAVFGN